MSKTTDNAMDLERQFWDKANDSDFYEKVLSHDSVAVMEPMGFVDKKTAVAMAKEGSAWKEVEFFDQKKIQISPDSVAVIYHAKGTKEEMKAPYQVTIASIYAKREDDWQLVLTVHQPWNPDASEKKKG